jgi:hypothetical protein
MVPVRPEGHSRGLVEVGFVRPTRPRDRAGAVAPTTGRDAGQRDRCGPDPMVLGSRRRRCCRRGRPPRREGGSARLAAGPPSPGRPCRCLTATVEIRPTDRRGVPRCCGGREDHSPLTSIAIALGWLSCASRAAPSDRRRSPGRCRPAIVEIVPAASTRRIDGCRGRRCRVYRRRRARCPSVCRAEQHRRAAVTLVASPLPPATVVTVPSERCTGWRRCWNPR